MGQSTCSRCGEVMPPHEAVCPNCGFQDLSQLARSSVDAASPGGVDTYGPGGDRVEHPWPKARNGLDTYRSGLIAKLLVLVSGMLLVFLAAYNRSYNGVMVLTVVMVVGGLITSIWMLAGLAGYAKVPELTGGRGAASVSLVVLIINVLIEVYVAFQTFNILGGGGYRAARSFMKQQPYLEGLGNVLGLLGILALLFSLNRVSRFCGRDQGDRVSTTVILILVTAVCAFIVRMLIAHGEIRSLAALIFVVGGLLALAIATLVKVLGVLKDTRQAMLPV